MSEKKIIKLFELLENEEPTGLMNIEVDLSDFLIKTLEITNAFRKASAAPYELVCPDERPPGFPQKKYSHQDKNYKSMEW